MKKFIKAAALLLCVSLLVFSFAGCGGKNDNPAPDNSPASSLPPVGSGSYKFGVVLLVENGAFTDMRDGIIKGLNNAGFTDENSVFDYKCASGDTTSLSTICSAMDDGSYTAVFTVATPTTQQFVNLESETPCFFCAVSAPVAAGVISDMATPDKNATGTSNAIPVDDIFALADTLTPGIDKWGFIYCSSEANAANTVASGEAYLSANGIAYVSKTVNNSSEVATVTDALIADGCTAIFVPNDSVVQSGVTSLAEICAEAKIPTYCSSATTVASGCLATVAIDDVGIGEKTAAMAVEYLNGKAIGDIPSIVVGADYVSINSATLGALGVTLGQSDSITVGTNTYSVNYIG